MISITSILKYLPVKLSDKQIFMATIMFVNLGNYAYNLVLGRILGPAAFADAAILITFLLVLSFVGMTFQTVTSKYAILLEGTKLEAFIKLVSKYALIIGLFFGLFFIGFNTQLQALFHTQSSVMFIIFGIGLPLYFLLSINRGIFQGQNNLSKLASTYESEMLVRFMITLICLLLFPIAQPTTIIAIGIIASFVFGLIPFNKSLKTNYFASSNEVLPTKPIVAFFALTAFYELTQIIINNSDIMMVKHYFNNEQAGLYASLALIGRVVYFVTWMFVMMLLPQVIQLQKDGKNTVTILAKYVTYISILCIIIITATVLFPELIVKIMFGSKYLDISFLLWKYALATSLFALANIFTYYYLSLGKYVPVIVSGILGFVQLLLIGMFHKNLEQVVEMQIIAMIILLSFQLLYFVYQNKKSIRLN